MLNQCDGCRRRLPIDDRGVHYNPDPDRPYDRIYCSAYKYGAVGREHVRATHPPDRDCGPYGCNVCNLFICEVCGLAEGSLTTECPGVQSYGAHGEAVYAGKEDFVGGQWVMWCVCPPPHDMTDTRQCLRCGKPVPAASE